jgi:hypothetical protein
MDLRGVVARAVAALKAIEDEADSVAARGVVGVVVAVVVEETVDEVAVDLGPRTERSQSESPPINFFFFFFVFSPLLLSLSVSFSLSLSFFLSLPSVFLLGRDSSVGADYCYYGCSMAACVYYYVEWDETLIAGIAGSSVVI